MGAGVVVGRGRGARGGRGCLGLWGCSGSRVGGDEVGTDEAPARHIGRGEAAGYGRFLHRGAVLRLPVRKEPLDPPEQRIAFGALGAMMPQRGVGI
jgi:hypothetical protein